MIFTGVSQNNQFSPVLGRFYDFHRSELGNRFSPVCTGVEFFFTGVGQFSAGFVFFFFFHRVGQKRLFLTSVVKSSQFFTGLATGLVSPVH